MLQLLVAEVTKTDLLVGMLYFAAFTRLFQILLFRFSFEKEEKVLETMQVRVFFNWIMHMLIQTLVDTTGDGSQS